jgi:membrane protein DedA with SNARE-associated domain
MEEIRSWPWAWAWLTLFVIVLLRAGATYGIGRLVAAGVLRRREPGPRVRAAAERVDRWGPPVVTASFLTVGAQTVVNAGAGLARMTFPRYLVGLVPGAALWATVWSTIGAGAFLVALRTGRERGEAVWLAVAALVLVVVVAAVASRRRRGRVET